MAGMFEIIAAIDRHGWRRVPHRDGRRLGATTTRGCARGVERLFAPIDRSQLVQRWIPALDGVDATLRFGGRVADVGCGPTVFRRWRRPRRGRPASTFDGYDIHKASIVAARTRPNPNSRSNTLPITARPRAVQRLTGGCGVGLRAAVHGGQPLVSSRDVISR